MSLVHPPRLTRPSRTGRRFPVHLPDHLPDNPSAGALTAALADLPDTYVPRSPGFIPRYEPNPFLAWDPDPDPDVRHPPPSCN